MSVTSTSVSDWCRRFEDIPCPPSLPLLGHVHLILNKESAYDMTKFSAGLQEKYGDIVRSVAGSHYNDYDSK